MFYRSRNRRSKRVDSTLATDMRTHAHRKNYDIAVLVAGDEDYVPLVEAVKPKEGAFFGFYLRGEEERERGMRWALFVRAQRIR